MAASNYHKWSSSRHDLSSAEMAEHDEDVWFNMNDLLKQQIADVHCKWNQIDDKIWGKLIIFERNRRVAKAYLREQLITISGSDVAFDGRRIGLNYFDNPVRDPKTAESLRRLQDLAVKMKMKSDGSIRFLNETKKGSISVKRISEENALNADVTKLEYQKPILVFDMTKFQQNLDKEKKKNYPNVEKMETQCLFPLVFSGSSSGSKQLLNQPNWAIVINIVAMDKLKDTLVPPPPKILSDIKNRPRLPAPEEDPYSITGSGASSGGSSGKDKQAKDKGPKLPPWENGNMKRPITRDEYDPSRGNLAQRYGLLQKNNNNGGKDRDRKYDDPYYCGLRARTTNMAKNKTKDKPKTQMHPAVMSAYPAVPHSRSFESGMAFTQYSQLPHGYRQERNYTRWMATYPDSNDLDLSESPYGQIYGRVPLPNRAYYPFPSTQGHSPHSRNWD